MTDKPLPPGIPVDWMKPGEPRPMPEPKPDPLPWVGKRKGKARKKR